MLGRLRRLLPPGVMGAAAGLLDQVVISLTNLAVGLLVLRLGTKEEFGLYGLGYTAVIMTTGFSGALCIGPMTATYHQRPEAERAGFVGGLFLALAAGSGALGLLAYGIAAASGFSALSGSPAQTTAAAALLAIPPAMLHDLSRAWRFLRGQPGWALALDGLNAALWLGLTLLLIRLDVAEHEAALGGYGIACSLTALAGLVRSGLVVVGARRAAAAVRSVWDGGRWAMGGVAITALQNQAHLYLLAWLGGAAQVAEVNAARMLMAPVSILLVGVNRGMLPLLARLHAEGRTARFRAAARWMLLAVLGMVAAYLLAIFLAWDLLTEHVLRGDYSGIGVLVLIWGAAFAFQAADANASARLQATGRFRSLMLLNLWTAIPVVALAIPMILWLGGTGSLLTLAAGQAAVAALLMREAAAPAEPGAPEPHR